MAYYTKKDWNPFMISIFFKKRKLVMFTFLVICRRFLRIKNDASFTLRSRVGLHDLGRYRNRNARKIPCESEQS